MAKYNRSMGPNGVFDCSTSCDHWLILFWCTCVGREYTCWAKVHVLVGARVHALVGARVHVLGTLGASTPVGWGGSIRVGWGASTHFGRKYTRWARWVGVHALVGARVHAVVGARVHAVVGARVQALIGERALGTLGASTLVGLKYTRWARWV